jgi:hypothetical protein
MLRECLNHWLRRYGEPFQAGAQGYRGLFFQPPGSLLRWLFSPEALGELPRPLWAVAGVPLRCDPRLSPDADCACGVARVMG